MAAPMTLAASRNVSSGHWADLLRHTSFSVASAAQRTPTYASPRWLPRASSGSQLGPVPGGPIYFAILRSRSPARLNVHLRTPRLAGSLGPRLARNSAQCRGGEASGRLSRPAAQPLADEVVERPLDAEHLV